MSAHSDSHNHPTLMTFVNVLLALLVLTVITVVVAQFDFGALNTLVAMFVASIKAALVLLYFMHLKYDNLEYPVVFFVGVFFLFVMFGFSQLDVVTRIFESQTL